MKLQPVGLVFSLFVSLGLISFSCASGDTVDGGTGTGNTTGSGSAGTTGSGNRAGTTGTGNTTGSAGTTGRAGTTGTGNTTGIAGTTGTGNVTGIAGTTGAGNVTGSGTAGTTGAGNVSGCQTSNTAILAAANTMIDNFTMAGNPGVEVMSGGSIFGFPTTGANAPTVAGVMTTGMTIMASVPESTAPIYGVGAGIGFNDCINASAFTGVEFTISGSVTGTGCAVQFGILDTEHVDPANGDKKGSAVTGSYPAALTLTSTAGTMMVPWSGPPATSGSPTTAIDPTKLTGIQWQFVIPMGTSTCAANLTITNVAFY